VRLEAILILAVITFSAWAWETRDLADPLLSADYQVKITLAAAGGPYPSHFAASPGCVLHPLHLHKGVNLMKKLYFI
jgi:hypothetical protein